MHITKCKLFTILNSGNIIRNEQTKHFFFQDTQLAIIIFLIAITKLTQTVVPVISIWVRKFSLNF